MDKDMFMDLLKGITNLSWQNGVMLLVGVVLLYLAIVKDFEPLLLLPIGMGCIWANLPISNFLGEYIKFTEPMQKLATEAVDGVIPSAAQAAYVAEYGALTEGDLALVTYCADAANSCVVDQFILADGNKHGMLSFLYEVGVANELFPLLIFVGIGVMTDFGPLLENPKMVLLGGAGQFGIFITLLAALAIGFTRQEAASIGIIGAIDGPTSIIVSSQLAEHMLGPITVAAYSYMSLVPIIMPPVMRALTPPKARAIKMPYTSREISKTTRVIFPVAVTVLVGILVPFALPLVGSLMIGNLMRECAAVPRLASASENELNNVVTLFLGLAIGSTMVGDNFIKVQTLFIMVLGLFAFGMDTAVGVIFGHIFRIFYGGKFNPMIGAAGICAFPMAARIVQKEASRADYSSFVLMHAMGANAAGQIASAMAGGVVLALVPRI
jgi:oxaloacetate decarboxylase beta subunit